MSSPVRAVTVAAVLAALVTAGCGAAPPASTTAPERVPSRSATSPAVPSGTAAGAPRRADRGVLRPGMSWQWQLSGALDLSVPAQVYDLDATTTTAAAVAELHRRGVVVICYVDVGTWEAFRPDAAAFAPDLIGSDAGWPGERWLDVRQVGRLLPLLGRRLDVCRGKGFDAVEPDNVDGYSNDTGFPLTAAHQLAFNRSVADAAHARGLLVGLKNDLDQIPDLLGDVDFAVDEQCVEFDECDELLPFVRAGKPVFHAEYHVPVERACREGRRRGFSTLVKDLRLSAVRRACP